MIKWNEVKRKAHKDTFCDSGVIVSDLLSDVDVVAFALNHRNAKVNAFVPFYVLRNIWCGRELAEM